MVSERKYSEVPLAETLQFSGPDQHLTSNDRLGSELLQKASQLLDELKQLQAYIVSKKQVKKVEFRQFTVALQTELKILQKYSSAPSTEKTGHQLRSSNLLYFESVWDVAKQCSDIINLKQRFYWSFGEDLSTNRSSQKDKKSSVDIDIVAKDGREWIKVLTITSRNILSELAKKSQLEPSSGETEVALDCVIDSDSTNSLLDLAKSLLQAAKATRVQYQHPKLRLVLTRVERGETKEVDALLKVIEELGITVETSDDLPPAPHLDTTLLSKMTVDPFTKLTETLNIDCTMMLAFSSDISHDQNVEAESWHVDAIKRQIEGERKIPFLPTFLWPACRSRRLVCTREAAQRMKEIVETIGSDTEKLRARYLMDVYSMSLSQAERIDGFQKLSKYDVPTDWALPITTVNFSMSDLENKIPATPKVVEQVKNELLPLNQSTFLHGWARGITTMTSNGAVVKRIESTIEENRQSEADRGPDIWLCSTSRSLLSKEKEAKDNRGRPQEED